MKFFAAAGLMLSSLFCAGAAPDMLVPRDTEYEIRGDFGTITQFPPRAAGEGPVWRMQVTKRPDHPDEFALHHKMPMVLPQGVGGVAKFALRGIGASADDAQLLLYLRSSTPERYHPMSLYFSPVAGADWVEYSLPLRMNMDYAAGEAELLIMPSTRVQELEVADFRIERMPDGVDPMSIPFEGLFYHGRGENAAWRGSAAERIRKHRMTDAVIEVVDASGKAVQGAKVDVQLIQHAFRFGSAIDAGWVFDETPDGEKYRDAFLRNFNAAVPENDLKWPALAEEWEGFSLDRAVRLLEWSRDHQLYMRGHTLIWPNWDKMPKEMQSFKDQPDELVKKIDAHIQLVATRTRGLVGDWDVVNEPRTNRAVQDIVGDEVLADWFKAAAKADPDAVLYLNEFDILSGGGRIEQNHAALEKMLQALLDAGAPVGGIGLQAHMSWVVTEPDVIIEVLDRFAKFNLPIKITEVSLNMNDETVQADYTRDFLTAAFSHPSVVGFFHWGFWEQRHWNPDAAMFRADWTPKASAIAYRKLVLEDWNTQGEFSSGNDGKVELRAFHGKYKVTVTHAGKTSSTELKISEHSPQHRIVLE